MMVESQEVARRLWTAFEGRAQPDSITERLDPVDAERVAIEADFADLDRAQMSDSQAATMVIDGALIAPEAYWYFLPRLADAVFAERADGVLLEIRLQHLDQTGLSPDEAEAVSELRLLLSRL